MSTLAAGLLVAAGVAAAVNWIGVARDDRRLVYGAKPATLVLLIAVAAALDAEEPAVKAWFLAGLVLSLAGDVFLMLPRGGGTRSTRSGWASARSWSATWPTSWAWPLITGRGCSPASAPRSSWAPSP